MGRAATSKNRHTAMVGGQRTGVRGIRMAARAARLMITAAADILKRTRNLMNQNAARNALNRRATAESLVQVEVNQDTARALYLREMTAALEDTVVSKPTPQQVTDDGLTSMTVLTSDVVPQSPDAVAERIRSQMENLAETAQVQMQEVQNAQMAQIIERRTQLAIQALAQQLSAAEIRRFKAEFAKALAADIVIGAILNQTLTDLHTLRDANVENAANYNVADPTTDLNSSETKVMQDVYALMTAIFISRGSVSELADTLTQKQIEMNALTTQLQNLMNEGGDLINLEGGVRQIVTKMSQAVDDINRAVNALKASLESINDTINSSTFLLDSEYTDYVALKGYVDSQIASLEGLMNDLQTYLDGINISADLAEIQRQKDLQATKLGVFRDALQTVSTDPAGAQGALDTARTEYTFAADVIHETGPTLTAAATAVPGISELTTERGSTPTQPAATAPSVELALMGETPKLQVPLGTIYALKDSVNTIQVNIDSYGQIILTTPLGTLLLKQSELRDVIQTLTLLMQRPSTTFMSDLNTYLQGLYTSMTTGRMDPADRGPLDAANYDLSKLRGDMATTETTRRGYVMNVLTISARTSNNTEKLLIAQMFLDRLTLAAKIAQLDLSAPVKPTRSGVVTASMNASRMSALLDSMRAELVINLESQLQAKTNLALARNAAGKYAKFLETRELVTVTDAAAIVAASDGVTTGTGALTTAVQNAQTTYTLLMNLQFARTTAERRLAKQEALRFLLGGRGTTYTGVRTLDFSRPSTPPLTVLTRVRDEKGATTSLLEASRGALTLNVASVRDSTAGLSLSQGAAGNLASFLQAQAVVASDGIAIIMLSGSVTTGTLAVTTAAQDAQTAKDVTAELQYTRTKAERDLSRQEGLRDLLEDRQTTDADVRTLDSSTPSKPSFAAVVDLATETSLTTTNLEERGRQAVIIRVRIRGTVGNLDLAGNAAGKHDQFDVAVQFVAAAGAAIIVAQGNVAQGITAVSDATTAASNAFTEMNLQYTATQTVYIGLTTVEGTVVYLQTTFLPNVNIDLSAAKALSDTTFTFLITRRLFPQSLSIFGVSTSDLRGYYANKMQIKLSISDSINTDSLQDSEGDVALSIATINDNKTAVQTISASLDGLKAELASLGLTDISVYTIIPNTLDAQNFGLDTIADSADALSGATEAMNTAGANLSESVSALAEGKQFIQVLVNTNVALSGIRMRLVLVSTVQSEKSRLLQLSQSQQDAMDTAREAAEVAAAAAADTPAKPDTSAVEGLQDAKAALDPNEMANTERLLQIYNDMKNDPSFINGKAELEQFFQRMGTTYDTMQDAKMRLIEQLTDLQYEAVVLDTARARMAELQALLEGAKGLDTSSILRDADIAKLMGEAAAYKAQQSTAKDAKENAALQADIDPSTTELMANIALLESLQQQYETLQNDTNTKEADLLDLQSRINALMQGMKGIDARTLLRNYQLKVDLAESQRTALEARITAEKANQTVNVNLLMQLTADLARLNAKIIALRTAIESITKLQTLKADILRNNPQNTPTDKKAVPPVSLNLSMFLKFAAAATALALGGLAFYYLGPNNIGDMFRSDCDKGKKAAEDAIKENSMAVKQQANFAGLKWAKQNTTAGETSAVPTLPDVPPEEEEPAPPPEEEPTPPTEEELASMEANGDTGGTEVMSGGDSSYAIPQEYEANEAEGAEGEEGAEDEEGATGDTGPQTEEGADSGSSFNAPGIPQKGTREQLTSDDTQIPQSILDKIYAKYLLPPMVLKYTYGKAPSASFISCFKMKVETELGAMWSSAFTAGANGVSLFDFSGLLGELLGSAATAVTSQGNQETATTTGDTGDTGTSTNSTTNTTGAQGDIEPSYAQRQEEQAAANPYAYY